MMLRTKTALLVSLLGSWFWTFPARAENESIEFSVRPDGVVAVNVGTGQVVGALPVPQGVHRLVRAGHFVLVSLKQGGIGIINVAKPKAPIWVRTVAPTVQVEKFTVYGKKLFVPLADGSVSAYEFDEFVSEAVSSELAPPSPLRSSVTSPPVTEAENPAGGPHGNPPEVARARVVIVRNGWVVIEADAPLQIGDRFKILRPPVDESAGGLSAADVSKYVERTGMFVVERVKGLQGAGRLVRNAYAEVGDVALPKRERFKESLLYGQRFPNQYRWLTDLWLGPVFGSLASVGLIGYSALEYRFRFPLKLAVELGPVKLAYLRTPAFGQTFGTLATGGSLRGVVGVALSGFEFSLGLGVSAVTSRQPPPALQMGLSVRAGSLDGMSVSATTNLSITPTNSGTAFESFMGAWHIPVHKRVTMAAVGGLGVANFWAFGSLDFYGYVVGTGGPGTWIVRTGLGGLAYGGQVCGSYNGKPFCLDQAMAGPLFHLGFDRRF